MPAVEGASAEFAQCVHDSLVSGANELDASNIGLSELPPWFENVCRTSGPPLPGLIIKVARALDHLDLGTLSNGDLLQQLDDIRLALRSINDQLLDMFGPQDPVPLDDESFANAEPELSESLSSTAYALQELSDQPTITAAEKAALRLIDGAFPAVTIEVIDKQVAATERILETRRRSVVRDIIHRMRNLERVYLSNNNLTSVPTALTALSALQLLDLSGNTALCFDGLEQGRSFGTLSQLYLGSIDLRATHITGAEFPILEELGLFGTRGADTLNVESATLRRLDLSETTGVRTVHLDTPALEALDISGSEIQVTNETFANLQSLKEFDGSETLIARLPTPVLPSLVTLNLSHTAIDRLPPDELRLAHLNLRTLDLSYCGLSSLPSEIGELTELRDLDLSGNNIATLPASITKLIRLHSIGVEHTRLPNTMLIAARQGVEDLTAFLNALDRDAGACRQVKVLFVGEGNVGKSSLVAALHGAPFQTERPTTHGIELSGLPVDGATDGVEALLMCWDFGGQHVYRVSHPFFFSKDAIYLMVWRPRDGPEQGGIEYWLEAIRHRVGLRHCKVVLVSTHRQEGRTTLLDTEAVSNEYYPAVVAHHSVDSRDGSGLVELREELARLVPSMPHFGSPFPSAWERLRHELPCSGRGFLLLGEYEQLAAKHGLSAIDARSCARLLHKLGDVLYFDEMDGLPPVLVTDPEVLTRAVSYVLEDGEARDAGGVLTLGRLRELLEAHMQEVRSAPDVLGVLVSLMRRFDIAFELEGAGGPSLLLAEMLPRRRPLDLSWEPGDPPGTGESEIRMDYRFGASPDGLMAWLIVRNHRLLARLPWANGAVFSKPEHDASCLVELHADRRSLTVSCRGGYPLDLFMTLKSDAEALLAARWPYLPVSRFLPCAQRFAKRCSGLLSLDYVHRKLKAGGLQGECQECLTNVDLRSLTTGVAPGPNQLSVVTDHLELLSARIDAGFYRQSEALAELSVSLRHLRRDVLRGMEDTPLVFTLTTRERVKWHRLAPKAAWSLDLSLQLWCEDSDNPHLTGDPYFVRVERAWLRTCLPYLKYVSRILQFAPVVGSFAKMVADDDSVRDLGETLQFISHAEAALSPDRSAAAPVDRLGDEGGVDFDARLVRTLIMDLESPPRRFRGLQAVVLPGRPVMWVCPDHHHAYQGRAEWDRLLSDN